MHRGVVSPIIGSDKKNHIATGVVPKPLKLVHQVKFFILHLGRSHSL